MSQNNVFNIGIWGPPRASKTTYLAALYLEFLNNGWQVEPITDNDYETYDFIESVASELVNGNFPAATMPDEQRHRRYGLSFRKPQSKPLARFIGGDLSDLLPQVSQKRFTLEVVDIPGESITHVPPKLSDEEALQYFAYLSQCTGILMMIDPDEKEWSTGNRRNMTYYTALEKLFSQIKSDTRIPKLAVCLMKADRDHVGRLLASNGNDVEACVQEYIGVSAYNRIQTAVDRMPGQVEYFAVSVAGFVSIPGTMQKRPNVTYLPNRGGEVILYPNQRQAVNLSGKNSPLNWILRFQ